MRLHALLLLDPMRLRIHNISLSIRVPANLRSLVYYYGIATGGEEEWDFAFKQLLRTSVASESMKLMHGLAASSEPWILSR